MKTRTYISLSSSLVGLGLLAAFGGGCGGTTDNGTGQNAAIFMLINASNVASVTHLFTNAVPPSNGHSATVPQGARGCAVTFQCKSANDLGSFQVKDTSTGNIIFEDANKQTTGPLDTLVYLVFGPASSLSDEKINLSGGSGGANDLWVTDVAANDATNYQVSIKDTGTGTVNIVSPVQGVANSRTAFEDGLTGGHSYLLTLNNGAGKVFTTTFTAPTAGLGTTEPVVAVLSDFGGTEQLKTYFIASSTCSM